MAESASWVFGFSAGQVVTEVSSNKLVKVLWGYIPDLQAASSPVGHSTEVFTVTDINGHGQRNVPYNKLKVI